ncbi:Basic-leucine zipper domain [Dillenia turbinata]|uniref:Basic-leucine zipper domain n=1 Tax=Dillenia turbinata TaxID=194707 RepID=A0AAN8WGK3_9MAGN
MASSKVMSTSSAANSANTDLDLYNQSGNFGSMNMDDILKNIYASDNLPPPISEPLKSVDEVWSDIVAGRGSNQTQGGAGQEEEMTLEDFLTKAGAVREEDVRIPPSFAVDSSSSMFGTPLQPQLQPQPQAQFGNGVEGRRRGKRRAVVEEAIDKASQQKQRRMIKNRESAARSRERKQAYTVELESLVTQLEEEHARLVREEADQRKERFKQLMENLIPVVERRRPPCLLRRVQSLQW